MNFTNDEMNLMCIYNTGSRESLMRELREMRGQNIYLLDSSYLKPY